MDYEQIGEAAFMYFIAKRELFNARNQRQIARINHLCTNERIENGDDVKPYPCYIDKHLKIEDWCDSCKYCQPFHLTYIAAAKKARIYGTALTSRCKIMLANQDDG